MLFRLLRTGALGAFAMMTVACGGAPLAPTVSRGPTHDIPLPADADRAELALRVDLRSASDCEEQFDLAVYKNRAVELIAWDEQRGSCDGRDIRIRYVPRMLPEAELRQAVTQAAVRVVDAPAAKKEP